MGILDDYGQEYFFCIIKIMIKGKNIKEKQNHFPKKFLFYVNKYMY